MKKQTQPKRILGTQLYRKILGLGIFDRVEYVGYREGQPGVNFEVERSGYHAFLTWHGRAPLENGYGSERGNPSRISLLSVSMLDPQEHLMWWQDYKGPQCFELRPEYAQDQHLQQFLSDIVAQFR